RSCLVTGAKHLKHELQRLVPTLADTASQQLLARNQQGARVREFESIQPAVDDDAALATVVGVDQRVDQGLLQGIDDRRSRHTIALSVRLKRTLHAGARRELQHDPLVKLKEITLPG